MKQQAQPRTLVLALGNPIRSDDGVGIAALRRLEEDPRVPSAVDLVEGGTKGLELVAYISGISRLLVLDAVEVGAAPGTIVRIQGAELCTLAGKGNVHDLALADILNALRLLGQQPRETILLGVQPRTTELGTSLSKSVESALPLFVEGAIAQLSFWVPSRAVQPCDEGNVQESVLPVSQCAAGSARSSSWNSGAFHKSTLEKSPCMD
jgi:hydrogenase maturation protease